VARSPRGSSSPSHWMQGVRRASPSTTDADVTSIGRSGEPPASSLASVSVCRTSFRSARCRSRCVRRKRGSRATRLTMPQRTRNHNGRSACRGRFMNRRCSADACPEAMKISGVALTIALAVFGFACGEVTPPAEMGAGGKGGASGMAGGGAAGTTGTAGASGGAGTTGAGGVSGGAGTTGAGGVSGGAGTTGAGGSTQCGSTCPAGTWDLDGNPATGVCGCEYTCNKISDADPIDAAFTDDNCDGTDGVVAQCVFVSATLGSVAGAGTRAQPAVSLARGIDIARTNGLPAVCVAGGVYSESVTVVSGISVYGGFDATNTRFAYRRSATARS